MLEMKALNESARSVSLYQGKSSGRGWNGRDRQRSSGKNGNDTSLPLRCRLRVPRRPDGKEEIQQIREHVDRAGGDQEHTPVNAITVGGRIPGFPHGIALKEDRQEGGNVKGQVAPNQNVTGPIDASGLFRCENTYQLQEKRGFGEPDRGRVQGFKSPGVLDGVRTGAVEWARHLEELKLRRTWAILMYCISWI